MEMESTSGAILAEGADGAGWAAGGARREEEAEKDRETGRSDTTRAADRLLSATRQTEWANRCDIAGVLSSLLLVDGVNVTARDARSAARKPLSRSEIWGNRHAGRKQAPRAWTSTLQVHLVYGDNSHRQLGRQTLMQSRTT